MENQETREEMLRVSGDYDQWRSYRRMWPGRVRLVSNRSRAGPVYVTARGVPTIDHWPVLRVPRLSSALRLSGRRPARDLGQGRVERAGNCARAA